VNKEIRLKLFWSVGCSPKTWRECGIPPWVSSFPDWQNIVKFTTNLYLLFICTVFSNAVCFWCLFHGVWMWFRMPKAPSDRWFCFNFHDCFWIINLIERGSWQLRSISQVTQNYNNRLNCSKVSSHCLER